MTVNTNIKATYRIETAQPLDKVAEMMAGEQSSGTFVKLPGETPELKEKYGAKVEEIINKGRVAHPSLPGARPPADIKDPYQQAIIKIAWPFDNIGTDITALMAAVAGNLYEFGPLSGIKLLDIEIPGISRSLTPGHRYAQPTQKIKNSMEWRSPSKEVRMGMKSILKRS